MAQETKPLLVVDDDFAYGVAHEFYPELQSEIENGLFKVMSTKDAQDSGMLSTQPSSNVPNYYVYNSYVSDKNYYSLDDPNLEHDFGIAKSNAIKESLRRLGAKEIAISKTSKNATSNYQHGNVGANKGPISGNMNVDYNKDQVLAFTLNLKMSDPANQASPYAEARSYIYSHGLAGDPFLSEWLSLLQERGRITGKETMTVSYFEEINKALDIAAKLQTPTWGTTADYGNKSKTLKELHIELSVDFG